MRKKENDTEDSLFDQAAETPRRAGGKQTSAFLRRSAKEITHYRIIKKVTLFAVLTISSFLLVVYAFSLLYDRTGRFTVSVKDPELAYNITLCENAEFATNSSLLINDNAVKLNNVCGEKVIPKNINEIDGDHSDENCLAYTFYCKNLRSTECALNYEISYNNAVNSMDEAIRVRLYIDGEYTDYAKTRSDGGGKEEHLCDKTFANKNTVCFGLVNNVKADGIVKFTIVIWLEGDDVDCNDGVLNGSVKFSMEITAHDPE